MTEETIKQVMEEVTKIDRVIDETKKRHETLKKLYKHYYETELEGYQEANDKEIAIRKRAIQKKKDALIEEQMEKVYQMISHENEVIEKSYFQVEEQLVDEFLNELFSKEVIYE